MVVGFTIESVPITTNVVSSNPTHEDMYSIQHYVIILSVTLCRSVIFSEYSGSSTNKIPRHNIAKILLKVAFNTITTNPL